MFSDLLKLVIRGERGEGKSGEGGEAHLPRFYLPHAKLHHHNTFKGRSKKFYRGALSSHSVLSSSAASSSSWGTSKSSLSPSSSSSPFSHYRRRVEISRSKNKKKESREEGRGRDSSKREGQAKPADGGHQLHQDSLGAGSHHSSKVSLQEARHQVIDNEPVVGAVRLSHQAAFHKIAVRPRRTHGAPRSKRATQIGGQISLPDVIEEANSKNATFRKPSSVATASPSPSIAHPDADIVEESISTSVESQAHIENEFDKKEKDKEEKRDEPLFQRLFGSKRSGRRQSRGSGDDSRENSVSPLRRGGDQRASRERRDSSGTRFPAIVGASSKVRQDSHPLPPSGRTRETSKERLTKEGPSSSPRSLLVTSVEGSLESTTTVPQPNFHLFPYDERPIRLTEGVRKVKSFREVPEQNLTREVVRRKVSSQTNVEDQMSVPTKISRISASLESLEAEEVTRKSSVFYANSDKTILNETSSSQRSSTDSLTTTPLPGVFIRQQSQSHNKTVLHKHQEHLQQAHHQQICGLEVNLGPFSLDSSISLQSRESEDFLRKAASVDHVSCTVDTQHQARELDTKEQTAPKSAEVKATTGLTLNIIEGKIEFEKSDSKKSPGQIIRSHSIHKCEETPIEGSPPEEGEVEGECTPRRPLRKEPSMKRLPPRDPEPSPVPEFMRIQLNRVESKGQSVVYDTEQEKNAKNDRKDVEMISKKPEALAVTESIQKEVQIYERPIESSVILKKEASNILNSKEYKVQTASPAQKSSIQENTRLFRDTSPSENTTEYGDGDSGTEGTLSDSSVERVVLRKPLVLERAPIIERACSVTNQTPSPPSAREQPELFKVFARRSFKVKDDKDKSESTDIDETDVEASSEVSEVTISPVRTHNNSSPVPCGIGSPLSSVSLSVSPEGLQKPSINAISFNRKSVGNPALSFCLPPVSAADITVSPLSSKPIVLILSNKNITGTIGSEITITSSSQNITTTTSTTNITTSSSQSKQTTMPIQVTAAHPIQTAPVIPAVPESSFIISTTPPTGIISQIISNRVTKVASINDNCSGNETENSSSALVISSTPTKSSLSSRSGSGIIWPPRSHQDQEESQQTSSQMQILTALSVVSVSQQNKLSVNTINDYEETRDSDQTEETEIEVSPLDIGAARRRFMSGGKNRPRASVTLPAQNLLPASTPPALGTPPSSSANTSSGPPSSINAKTGSSVTEARNTTPSFTITVRTQAAPSTSRSDSLPATTSVTNPSTDLNSSITSTSSTTSIGKPEQGTTQQAAEDWRVLVRQRREDRLKQTKTPDSEEIIIETRPPVSRNSKVLEMANNFQKLQVA